MRPVSGHLNNVIAFDAIEPEKENIIPLQEGRSARELSRALASESPELHIARVGFEKRLLEELEDMDDPLQLFLDYISWINNAFPQGGTSKRSGMLDVVERCIMYFKDMETYKNDPRYLKVWLWYVELYCSGLLQESKDVFVYMFRKRIGAKLALFYEEFASLLFQMGKFKEAHSMLQLGVEENSRPQGRLLRKIQEFEDKLREMDVNFSHGPQPDTRFLESDQNSFILGRRRSSLANVEGMKNMLHQQVGSPAFKNEIFQDDALDTKKYEILKDGWDILESKSTRSKENKLHTTLLEPGSNVGKLQQITDTTVYERPSTSQKLSVFKDDLGRSDPVYEILHAPGKKQEKIDCNFNLIYPKTGEEFCIEEILAKSRNVYFKKRLPPSTESDHSNSVDDENHGKILRDRKRRKRATPLGEQVHPKEGSQSTGEISSGEKSPGIFPSQLSTMTPVHPITGPESLNVQQHSGYRGVTKTSILPLRDTSEEYKTSSMKANESLQPPKSPTITFFSKAAMNEVYSMYNQHYNEPKRLLDNDDNTNKYMFDNLTQDFTRQHMDDLTEVKATEQTEMLKVTPIRPNTEKESNQNLTEEKVSTGNNRQEEFMTPIQERTENTRKYSHGGNEKHRASTKGNSSTTSSPFLTRPEEPPHDVNDLKIIENPLDATLREQMLAGINPPLDHYDTFYRYKQSLKMSLLLKRIHKTSKTENKNPIVDFKKTGELYCIRSELGEGGYATVYLAESSTGNLRALKVEKPASVWEYYILKQVEDRLEGHQVLSSIINAYSLHCFQDESYLVLNYASQGTLLDLINLRKEQSKGPLDESLCMFFTVELMKVIEAIHEAKILHGDLKSDNCMIRFEKGFLGSYRSDGSQGWSKKGIYLIDFGRSFDLKLLEPNTKFKANWKTDQQDCFEMRSGKPWTYEADYYGLAGIIHAMLFGSFIESIRLPNGRFKLKQMFKRYWQQKIWTSIFDILLNSGRFGSFPLNKEIARLRLELERHLYNEVGDKLKDIIVDLEPELTRFRR
ncbi:BUB1 (YGR188C) and MAD3 (YJL013C) [Zygosaccharomyces parabailii]|uniref:ZYBA0S12-02564g1_1 n=1 Tax=Zygosaccharomyces bailii (strain CLIB 213 / ATCC 58445 / CBS 680 / BCRC 21525 / NBRC 1098 / NCYC 1416 / NRRL Y-2227) TaxID=1333698 RepID=A0A8J2T9W7_ZYGB2|nr:BUB1 (YGR188C) and MAD3 (YJL013C) [Zygosaccharomyces parabailii]CDF91597.1 ZYBA0S12-02564g1_1 [Zygosaccharomyces bailii CLIB 213]CDH11040.1 related to BUB1-Ser/thr protein kinase [Zygosaccharomyces bailii ISA1307]